MKEKLTIKNFGPIKSVELELGRFNVLIGEQATGKSTVAKVLAVCRYFSYIVGSGTNGEDFLQGLLAWDIVSCWKSNSYISYSCKHYLFEIVNNTLALSFDVSKHHHDNPELPFLSQKITPLSREFTQLLKELENVTATAQFDSLKSSEYSTFSIPYSFYKDYVSRVMDNPFYLPTERGLQSIFSLGKSSIRNLSDSLFNQFAKLDQITRYFKEETEIEPLNIFYKNVNGHGYIRKASETEFYSLFNAASGYQSTIPVVLVMKYYNEIRRKSKTFLTEEPELNLFPTAQDSLMRYIVEISNKYDNSLLLTTQSPYILTSLSNMMYAYQVGKKDEQKVNNIVNKKYWLNPEDVSAYRLLSDGTCESIIDSEGLIKAERIDEASEVIGDILDKLINIEIAE